MLSSWLKSILLKYSKKLLYYIVIHQICFNEHIPFPFDRIEEYSTIPLAIIINEQHQRYLEFLVFLSMEKIYNNYQLILNEEWIFHKSKIFRDCILECTFHIQFTIAIISIIIFRKFHISWNTKAIFVLCYRVLLKYYDYWIVLIQVVILIHLNICKILLLEEL